MKEIDVFDKISNQSRKFYYDIDPDESHPERILTFRVHKMNPPDLINDRYFPMTIEKREDANWMITMIGGDDLPEHYTSKGIPYSLIPVAAKELDACITSSPLDGIEADFDKYRLPQAEDMWRRMVDQMGRADRQAPHGMGPQHRRQLVSTRLHPVCPDALCLAA